MRLKLLDPKDIKVRPEELDYDPIVATGIVKQLALGVDEIEVWNVPGAPTAEQLHSFLLENKEIYAAFNQAQLDNVNSWIKRTVFNELDEEQ